MRAARCSGVQPQASGAHRGQSPSQARIAPAQAVGRTSKLTCHRQYRLRYSHSDQSGVMINTALANTALGLTAMGVMLAMICLLTAADPIAQSHKGLAGAIAGAWCAFAPVGLLRSAIVGDPLAVSAWAGRACIYLRSSER
jgi:hypothetical protein